MHTLFDCTQGVKGTNAVRLSGSNDQFYTHAILLHSTPKGTNAVRLAGL